MIAEQPATIPKDPYPNSHLAGYSKAMPVEASETLFSPMTLLWVAVSIAAAAMLFGSMHRRKARLTDSLRNYVDREQKAAEAQQTRESKND